MDLAKLHLHWRVSRYNGKEYRSYSLARAIRQDGKNRREIVFKLGKITEEAAEQWRTTLKALKDPSFKATQLKDVVVTSNQSYLDLAVLLEVWNTWELNGIFDDVKSKRTIPLSSVAAALVINRCVDPKSKSRVPTWFADTALSNMLDVSPDELNSSRIFRELSAIEDCKDDLCKHLYKRLLKDDPEAMKEFFYDLSSTTFTGSRCLLMKWGHCKEGYENHVVLALVVNTKGFPIYWETLPGGTADATTISWLLKSLQERLPVSLPTMVFDRGMVSDENLSMLEHEKIKYISAMDKNQIETLTSMDFSRFQQLTCENVEEELKKTSDFERLNDTAYCKEANLVDGRRYILTFNPQLFKDQRRSREDALLKVESLIRLLNEELDQAQKSRSLEATQKTFDEVLRKNNLQGFVKVALEEKYVPKKTKKMLHAIKTYQGTMIVDECQKKEVSQLDGFWLLVTNHSEQKNGRFVRDTGSVVAPYRDKVIIEASFRDIKSFIEIAPVHVWSVKHVKAHYTVCVLAHLLNRTVTLTLHEQLGRESKEVVSHERLYEALESCRLNGLKANTQETAYSLTQQKPIQRDLLERLKMTHLTNESIVGKLGSTTRVTSQKR